LFLIPLMLGALLWNLRAEEPEQAKTDSVRLQFIPPPMDGTISLGIYDPKGKLIRTLHREAGEEAFKKGLNGFITEWDGKDDAGNPAPAGKYEARGFTTGEFLLDGEAFHCNDWIDDSEARRIRRVINLAADENGKLVLQAEMASGENARLVCDDEGNITGEMPEPGAEKQNAKSPAPTGSQWIIAMTDQGREVRQIDSKGEFLRRLAIDPREPQPEKIAASITEDRIYLLEQNETSQRVRALKFEAKTESPSEEVPAVSTWKELFSKTIVFSDSMEPVLPLLKMPGGNPFAPQNGIRVSLRSNTLLQDQTSTVDLQIGFDAQGSFLQTADGLFLKRITETPHLKWATMAREPGSKEIVVFQSDGAAVEEYRVTRLANMMAFDCGDFELPTPGK
jgi:hypothetical protein